MAVSRSQMNLMRIACNSCSNHPSRSDSGAMDGVLAAATASSDVDSAALLQDLRLKIQETESAAISLINEVYDSWTDVFRQHQGFFQKLKDFVAKRLTVTIDGDVTLTEHQKNLMQIVLQVSNFVFFLENEETQAAYGQKVDSLTDLKGRMLQVVCAAKQLLPEFSESDIQGYVREHVHYSLQMAVTNESIRRTVCSLALELMATVLNSIDVQK